MPVTFIFCILYLLNNRMYRQVLFYSCSALKKRCIDWNHTNWTQDSHLKLYFLRLHGLKTSSYIMYDHTTSTHMDMLRIYVLYVWGLSIKILNNFNKSSAHLIWSSWSLSPSKYSPPLLVHCSLHFLQFWKYSRNASFGIMHSSASKFS